LSGNLYYLLAYSINSCRGAGIFCQELENPPDLQRWKNNRAALMSGLLLAKMDYNTLASSLFQKSKLSIFGESPIMAELPPEKKLELNRSFANNYLETDKPLVVKYIKGYIRHNGYVNTRYATTQKIKGKTFTNNEHRDAFYESVSAMLVNTGKYTREPNKDSDKGYNILLNPAYFSNRSVRLIAGLAALISLVTYITSLTSNAGKEYIQKQLRLESQHLEQENEILQSALQRIDMLDRRIQEIDSSVHRK
jgi:hypothetical protein